VQVEMHESEDKDNGVEVEKESEWSKDVREKFDFLQKASAEESDVDEEGVLMEAARIAEQNETVSMTQNSTEVLSQPSLNREVRDIDFYDDDRIDRMLLEHEKAEERIHNMIDVMQKPNCPVSVFMKYFRDVASHETCPEDVNKVQAVKPDNASQGLVTDPIYSSRRMLPIIDWLKELPVSEKQKFALPTQKDIRDQINIYGKSKSPFAAIGNKLLFIDFYDGNLEIVSYQTSGRFIGQCNSYSLDEFQQFLHESPKALETGTRMLLERIRDVKLKSIESVNSEIKQAMNFVRQNSLKYSEDERQFEVCQAAMQTYESRLADMRDKQNVVYSEYTNRLQLVQLNEEVVTLCETSTSKGTFCMRMK